MDVLNAKEALARLVQGNTRFSQNVRSVDALLSQLRRADLSEKQQPFAIILGCSDARAPAEIVFDQGLGDLFVIRVAGNIVAPSQLGSVELAARRLGVKLAVVMGHERCGAVEAAIDDEADVAPDSAEMLSIVERVRVSARGARADGKPRNREQLISAVVRMNVSRGCEQLRTSNALAPARADGLLVVGAVYDLKSGVVEFFDRADTQA